MKKILFLLTIIILTTISLGIEFEDNNIRLECTPDTWYSMDGTYQQDCKILLKTVNPQTKDIGFLFDKKLNWGKLYERKYVVTQHTREEFNNLTQETEIIYYDITNTQYIDRSSLFKYGNYNELSKSHTYYFEDLTLQPNEEKEFKIVYSINGIKNKWDFWVGDIQTKTTNYLLDPTAEMGSSLRNGILAYYTFDDTNLSGTDVYDVTNNSNDGVNNGATTGVAGIINESFDFEKNDVDWVQLSTNDFKKDVITFSGWLNVESSGIMSIFDTREVDNGVQSYNWLITTWSSQEIRMFTGLDSWGWNYNPSGFNLVSGVWYHLVVTANATNVNYYINGTSVGNVTTSVFNIDSSDNMSPRIGRSSVIGYAENDPYDGKLDEIGIWNRILNYSEIQALYNDGNGSQYPFGDLPVGYQLNADIEPNPHTSNEIVTYTANYTKDGVAVDNGTCSVFQPDNEEFQFFDIETPTNDYLLTKNRFGALEVGFLDITKHETLNFTITVRDFATTTQPLRLYACEGRVSENLLTYSTCSNLNITVAETSVNYSNITKQFNNNICVDDCNVSLFFETSDNFRYEILVDTVNSEASYYEDILNTATLQPFEYYIKTSLGSKSFNLTYNSTTELYTDSQNFSKEISHQDKGNLSTIFNCSVDSDSRGVELFEIINPNGSIQNIIKTDPIDANVNQTLTVVTNTPVDQVIWNLTKPDTTLVQYFNNSQITFNVSEDIGIWDISVFVQSNEFNYTDTRTDNFSVNCVERWECTDWGMCVAGFQTRTCTDVNMCGTTDNKPVTQEECVDTAEQLGNIFVLLLAIAIYVTLMYFGIKIPDHNLIFLASVFGIVISITNEFITSNFAILIVCLAINTLILFRSITSK